jgi:hypothetical protein
VQQVAGVGTDKGDSQDFVTALAGEDFDKSGFFALTHRAVYLAHGNSEHIVFYTGILRVFFT